MRSGAPSQPLNIQDGGRDLSPQDACNVNNPNDPDAGGWGRGSFGRLLAQHLSESHCLFTFGNLEAISGNR